MIAARPLFLALLLCFLTSCEHKDQGARLDDQKVAGDIQTLMASKPQKTKFDNLIEESAQRILRKDFDNASICLNVALQVQPNNANVHFFNGLNYHLMSLEGNQDKYDLAEVGYTQALAFNPHHTLALQQLGFLLLSQKRYGESKEILARCLLENPKNQKALTALSAACYYAGDLETSYKTIKRALEKEPKNPALLKNAAMIFAASGQGKAAQEYKTQYDEVGHKATSERLARRLKDWERLHVSGELKKPKKVAQLAQYPQLNPLEKDSAAGREVTGEEGPAASKRMAIIDVTILKTVESASTRKGINLLSQLAVNFNAYDLNVGSQFKKDFITGDKTHSFVRTLNRGISVGNQLFTPTGNPYTAITYTMNIVNSLANNSKTIARPTLIALDGKESVFFSGDKFIAGIAGNFGPGALDSREIGLELRVTPRFISDELLEVDVFAQQDFPDANLNDGVVQLKPTSNTLHPLDTTIQLSHNFVRSNVVLKFGQSLILSGLNNKVNQSRKDGIPVLQNIPILQLFASEKTTSEVNNTIVFILTPRRPGFGKYELSKAEQEMVKRGENLDRYLDRYFDNIKFDPNIHATFASLSDNDYFEEFKTGDVSLEDWWHVDNPRYILKQALEFMYF